MVAQYAVLGPYDFVSILEARDNRTIARVSAELASRGSVRIRMLPAVPVADVEWWDRNAPDRDDQPSDPPPHSWTPSRWRGGPDR